MCLCQEYRAGHYKSQICTDSVTGYVLAMPHGTSYPVALPSMYTTRVVAHIDKCVVSCFRSVYPMVLRTAPVSLFLSACACIISYVCVLIRVRCKHGPVCRFENLNGDFSPYGAPNGIVETSLEHNHIHTDA